MADFTVLVREGMGWRQYLVVTDRRVAVVEMVPALWGGWNFQRVTIQDGDAWTMSREHIVAWKMAHDDGRTSICGELPQEFRAKLLDRAGVAS